MPIPEQEAYSNWYQRDPKGFLNSIGYDLNNDFVQHQIVPFTLLDRHYGANYQTAGQHLQTVYNFLEMPIILDQLGSWGIGHGQRKKERYALESVYGEWLTEILKINKARGNVLAATIMAVENLGNLAGEVNSDFGLKLCRISATLDTQYAGKRKRDFRYDKLDNHDKAKVINEFDTHLVRAIDMHFE